MIKWCFCLLYRLHIYITIYIHIFTQDIMDDYAP